MSIATPRIHAEFPSVPEETIEDLIEHLASPRAVTSLLRLDTTDQPGEPPPEITLPDPTEVTMFGCKFHLYLPPSIVFRFLHDFTRYTNSLNRPRAFQWVASAYDPSTAYALALRQFVSAGCRYEPNEHYVRDTMLFLQVCFPNVSIHGLRTRLRAVHWDLYDATASFLEHHPRKPRAYDRPRPDVTDITSPYAAHLALNCLTLDPRALAAHDLSLSWRLATEEGERADCMFECQCCYESVPFEKLSHCPLGHLFCRDCLERTVASLVGEGRSLVRCLAVADCDCLVSIAELERCLPQRLVEQLIQSETLKIVMTTGIPNLVRCHSCGMPSIFENECEPRAPIFACPTCHAQTCILCGLIAHDGFSCEQMRLKDPTTLIHAKMNEALVRICPTCDAQILKEVGCNRMECPRCGTWFCYFCRQLIPKDVGYLHFWKGKGPIPEGKCPLFVKNKSFNKGVVLEAQARLETLFQVAKNEDAEEEAGEEEELPDPNG
jgi:hypothetical protein